VPARGSVALVIRRALLALTSALTLGFSPLYACDPCGMNNSVQVPGVMNSLRSTGLRPNVWTIGVSEQLSTFKVRGENELRTTDKDLELIRNLSVTQFTAAYNVSSQIAWQINAPLVVRNYDHFERFAKVHDTEAGLGDMSFLSTYSPYSFNDVESRIFVAGLGGIKAPTGDTGSLTQIVSDDGSSAGTQIQGRGLTLGTGSVDIPFGLVAYGRSGRLQMFSSAQYTIRTEGAADYRFADDLSWSAAPGWLFILGEEKSLATSLVVSGERKGGDHLNGKLLPKTAVNNVYMGPEVFYSVTGSVSVLLGVDLPISIDVGGAAVRPETRSRAMLSVAF
jgi:hypothetical protein